MKCSRCQQENPPDHKFCLECGTPLQRASASVQPTLSYADLQHSLTEAREQQTATSEILRVISQSQTDVQPVFDAIVRNAVQLCGALRGAVYRVENGMIHFVAHHNFTPEGLEARRRAFPQPLSAPGDPMARMTAEGQVARTSDSEVDAAIDPESRAVFRLHGLRSGLNVPMLRDGRVVGSIALGHSDTNAFTDDHIALLKTFADQAVIAIENVRLFKELEARNRDLTESLDQQTATAEILRVISQAQRDVQPVFDTIVRNAVRLCGALQGGVYRFDGEFVHSVAHDGYTPEQLRQWQATWPKPVSAPSVACQAIRTRGPILVRDFAAASELVSELVVTPETRANMRSRGSRSVMAVPMFRQNAVIGAISLAHGDVEAFSDAHVELLKTFADQAVIAIENVRLFTELQEKNKALTTAHAQVTEALDQQTATSEVLKVISRSTFDLQPVLDTLVENAVRLCGANTGLIWRFGGEVFRLTADYGLSDEARDFWERNPHRPGRGSLTGRTALERRPISYS